MNFLKSFLQPFKQNPELLEEVHTAHYHNLPDGIDVAWTRDGDYIVGVIKAGEKEFMTQGKGADDFVEMVHDAVYTEFNIPEVYRFDMKAYDPVPEIKQLLQNQNIKKSSFELAKAL